MSAGRVYLGGFARGEGRERARERAHAFDGRRLLDARTQRDPTLQEEHVRVSGRDHLRQRCGALRRRRIGPEAAAGACGVPHIIEWFGVGVGYGLGLGLGLGVWHIIERAAIQFDAVDVQHTVTNPAVGVLCAKIPPSGND